MIPLWLWQGAWQLVSIVLGKQLRATSWSIGRERLTVSLAWGFETSEPNPSATLPPIRPYLLILLKLCYSLMIKHSNMWGLFLFKPPHMKHFRLVSEIGVIENLGRTLQPQFVSHKAKLPLLYVLMRLSSFFILPSIVTLQLWVTPMSVSPFLVKALCSS